jgi:hypothetical protein
MKMMLLTLVTVISIAGNAQSRRVAKINNQSEILVSKNTLVDKIAYPISEEKLTIDSMFISSTSGNHYLLANTNKRDYVYIFQLKKRGGNLYLVRTRDVNGCKTARFDIANYTIDEDGQINGCNGLNYFKSRSKAFFSP